MKKIFFPAIIFILLFTVPVLASENPPPRGYYFNGNFNLQPNAETLAQLDLPEEILQIFEAFDDDGFALGLNGTVVSRGLQTFVYAEINLDIMRVMESLAPYSVLPSPQLMSLLFPDFRAPTRIWLEADLRDLEEPRLFAIVEANSAIRFAIPAPGFSRQFWVFDLSEILLEFEPVIIQIPDAERAEIFSYTTEALEDWFDFEFEITEMERPHRTPRPQLTRENSLRIRP